MARFSRCSSWCSLVLLGACTPIAPLDYDAGLNVASDAGRIDASLVDAGADSGADAGADGAVDAGVDPCAALEICDGIDNDCDPSTPDGSADPMLGAACDGDDGDLCAEGTLACIDGALACDDESADTLERCNGDDDDCDGEVDEEGAIGSRPFYPDLDGDGYGDGAGLRMACESPASTGWVTDDGDCDDTDPEVHPRHDEECNARDDDCDGSIDEGSACPRCDSEAYGGHTYLFCDTRETWTLARLACESYGYQLAVVEDAAESAFLGRQIGSFQGAWIGLSDRVLEGEYVWVDGTAASYFDWGLGEPRSSGDCVQIRGLVGGWSTDDCATLADYVCETR